MNAKEKAKEFMHYYLKELLSAKYSINGFVINDLAKQCALIAVDEVLNVLPQSEYLEDKDEYYENRERLFWKQVEQEIQKL